MQRTEGSGRTDPILGVMASALRIAFVELSASIQLRPPRVDLNASMMPTMMASACCFESPPKVRWANSAPVR